MLKFEFNFLPEINGAAFASIFGHAEIITVGRMPGFWSVGRIYIEPVGAAPVVLPDTHWLHQPLKLWVLQSNAIEIDALVRSQVAVAS